MSSKISRNKPVAETPILRFRSIHGIAHVRETAAESPSPNSRPDAEVEARIRAAYEQGLMEGRSAADSLAAGRAQEMVRPALDGFRTMVEDLVRAKAKLRGEAEEDVVKLALAISRRVLHRELAVDPEALIGLVRAAWDRVEGRETHRMRLSPPDAALVQQHRAALNLPPKVEIEADPALARGSALFETSRGVLDASVNTQLGEIERGLADVLSRHKAGV